MATSEYEILEKMATGSFGIVFKVRRVTDHQVFVMKRIPLLGLTESQRRDAAQEIVVMRGLHHPCVVSQRDAFLFNKHDLCLVMDYYDGGDMDTRMAAQRELDLYFDFDQVMLWFVQLVLGAQYLHAHNVVHRDIKIHNVFVRSKDMSVVLGDFGISERLGTSLASHTWAAAITMGGAHESSGTSIASAPAMAPAVAGGSPSPARNNNGDDTTPSLRVSGGFHPATSGGAGAGAAVSVPLLHQAAWSSGQWGAESPLESPSLSPYEPLLRMQQLSASSNAASSYSRGSQQRRLHGGVDGIGAMEAAMKGTPLYMAPEVLQGGAASPQSDVWSLGCVLYELLALRHPFESRDLAPLVMRVLRGQREPLPAHYPRPIADLINRMLCLDASQRPSCEEVLTVPCVRAYVDLWRSLRTPLDVPGSPGESALIRQLEAWQANIEAWNALHPGDPRGKSLHYTEIKRQMLSPACTPAEERESVERRALEAARATLSTAQPSGLLGSVSSFGVGGGGGVHDGTFFYGATGGRLTSAASGHGGGDLQSTSSREGMMGMAPSDSMRPSLVYDVAPELAAVAPVGKAAPSGAEAAAGKAPPGRPPRPSRCLSESPPPRPGQVGDLAITGHNFGHGGARLDSARPPAGVARCEDSPMMSAAAVQRRHQQRRKGDAVACRRGGKWGHRKGRTEPERKLTTKVASLAFDGAAAARMATPLGSRRASLSTPPLPCEYTTGRRGSLDEDALFFRVYSNVAEMRFATLDEIAQAVEQMRQRVQQSMRHQCVLTDIEVLHERHGSALLRSMPHVLHVLEVAAATEDSAEGPDSTSTGARPSISPEDVYARMVQQIDQQRGGREQLQLNAHNDEKVADVAHSAPLPIGRPLPPRIRELREAAALAQAAAHQEAHLRARLLPRGPKGSSVSAINRGASSSLAAARFADPAAPLMLASTIGGRSSSPITGTELKRWRPYVERRNRLSAALTGVFDAATLRAVYAYFRTCALLQRDAAVVRRLVPDRRQWAALPSIEELAVLDRRLEGMFEKSK
ncbi:hypothetical protein LSCM1_07273 [Leishmania martiniquensis]|uniref:Protein kinase domain-containing protein n=1 Tax=Leishmania martiniquensis TaxID=1580590 RepID=A0A836L273_9TRYP|nr:hypothetical protein LSCM1_07273 [Leishmania martiniquensis]